MNNVKVQIDISIVLIAWNVRELLDDCIKSILANTNNVRYEIILVDNNSIDGIKEMVKTNYPGIFLIENPTNRGVAPARNQGIKAAKGKYILILDADTKLFENSIEMMFSFMEKNVHTGVVGCTLVDGKGHLQYSCKRFPTIRAIVSRRLEFLSMFRNSVQLNNHIMKDWDHASVAEVDYVIGACQFIRSSALTVIGMYDEKIFYGPEDLDLCLRMWRANYHVQYFPHTKIYHLEQRVTKRNPFSSLSFKHVIGMFYLFRKYNFMLTRAVPKI
ncbi:MAG: glycosyltransferase family 2 protein [Bacteroidota bacterium]